MRAGDALALDAMGGDHAPGEIVLGAVEAAQSLGRQVLLVGDTARIEPFLPRPCPSSITLHPASEVVAMDEKPLDALRKKKDSSLLVAVNLVKEGMASAMVSAGNTGAASAAGLLAWRQMHGVHRPAIASTMPNAHGGFVLLDSGASPDVEPEHLVEFGLMGRAYCQAVMRRPDPKVHLLNIGEEDVKGNAFAKQAHRLLSRHSWFAGNIEGRDLFKRRVDVVVCDAFVGNIVLKTSEGVAEFVVDLIRAQLPKNKIMQLPYLPLRQVMAPLRKTLDYAEYGGSPLLGLNGLCIVCHGRSSARAIKNALLLADRALSGDVLGAIRRSFAAT
jgi:glycerol-3-phosphate acyltransferase PlsX